jgi:hypothetical protein
VRPSRPAAPARPWLGEKDAKHTGKVLTIAGTHVAAKAKVYPTRAPQPQRFPVRHIDPKSLTSAQELTYRPNTTNFQNASPPTGPRGVFVFGVPGSPD